MTAGHERRVAARLQAARALRGVICLLYGRRRWRRLYGCCWCPDGRDDRPEGVTTTARRRRRHGISRRREDGVLLSIVVAPLAVAVGPDDPIGTERPETLVPFDGRYLGRRRRFRGVGLLLWWRCRGRHDRGRRVRFEHGRLGGIQRSHLPRDGRAVVASQRVGHQGTRRQPQRHGRMRKRGAVRHDVLLAVRLAEWSYKTEALGLVEEELPDLSSRGSDEPGGRLGVQSQRFQIVLIYSFHAGVVQMF
mmetsp:Transcript_22377/g.62982  ORF Transcript_22377/g.62982 Transcript_22377/m.62982 type:complete len:249 (-) Transcript_22377:302-1048(-)